MTSYKPDDWKAWVRKQEKIDRLTILGPAEQAVDMASDCIVSGWRIFGQTYETTNGVQQVRFFAEREADRGQ